MVTRRPESQAALEAAQKKPTAQEDLNAELFAVLRKGAQLKKTAPPPQKQQNTKPAQQPRLMVALRKTGAGTTPQPQPQPQRSYRKSVRLDALMQELDK